MKKSAAKKQPKNAPVVTVTAKHTFNDEERLEIGAQLANSSHAARLLEEEKKQVASGYSAKIKAEEATSLDLSTKLSNGYEMRPVRAWVEFDPKKGRKTYYRLDGGAFLHTEEMSQADYEMSLPLDETTRSDSSKTGNRPEEGGEN